MSTALTASTLQDLIYDTRLLVGDSGDIANTYADKDIITAINYAIQQYCRFTGCNYVETTFAITNGATTNSFPFDYLMIQKSVWLGPSPLPSEFVSYTKSIGLDSCIKVFHVTKSIVGDLKLNKKF